jgi:hypothetical protein
MCKILGLESSGLAVDSSHDLRWFFYRCADKNSAIEVERDGTICLCVGNKRSFQKEVTYLLG